MLVSLYTFKVWYFYLRFNLFYLNFKAKSVNKKMSFKIGITLTRFLTENKCIFTTYIFCVLARLYCTLYNFWFHIHDLHFIKYTSDILLCLKDYLNHVLCVTVFKNDSLIKITLKQLILT